MTACVACNGDAEDIDPAREQHMQSQSRATMYAPIEDPEVELACLAADGGPLRRQLARIAGRLVVTQAWDRLGFARLGDYGRERVGLSARELQELAHVDSALATLPLLDEALVSGQLSWTKVRLLCRVASVCDERVWLELAESVSTRELARRVRAIESSARDGAAARGEFDASAKHDELERRETLRVPCADRIHVKWGDVRRLVRRVSGEWLPFAVCAEYVAAEVISALPLEVEVADGPDRRRAMSAQPEPARRVAIALPGARAAPSRFVAALAEDALEAVPDPIHVLLTSLRDKPGDKLAAMLAGRTKSLHACPVQLPRSRTVASLRQLLPHAEVHADAKTALAAVQRLAADDGGKVLVTGSLFLVSEVMALLGHGPVDP